MRGMDLIQSENNFKEISPAAHNNSQTWMMELMRKNATPKESPVFFLPECSNRLLLDLPSPGLSKILWNNNKIKWKCKSMSVWLKRHTITFCTKPLLIFAVLSALRKYLSFIMRSPSGDYKPDKKYSLSSSLSFICSS